MIKAVFVYLIEIAVLLLPLIVSIGRAIKNLFLLPIDFIHYVVKKVWK